MRASSWYIFLIIFTFYACDSYNPAPETQNDAHEDAHELPVFEDLYAINIQVDSVIPWNLKTSCSLTFSNSDDTIKGKIKCRGGISAKYWKHSFSLSLIKDTALFEGIKADDDFIINANYIDKTFMRHKLSYDLFRKMDSTNISPRCEYRHIFVNQNYEGLYVLMEEVDKSLVGVSDEDGTAMILKDGGLFVENHEDFFIQPGEDLYQQKYPKVQTSLHTKELNDLWYFLFQSSDLEFKKNVADHFDLKNIMYWHLLLLITNNGDGIVKNFYWYRGNDKRWRVVPWDYDDSFGRNGDYSPQSTESGWERNILLKRLYELDVDHYRQQLISQWELLSSTTLSLENIQAEISKNVDLLKSVEVEWNFKKWPINSPDYLDSNNFEQEVEIIRNYFNLRYPEIDSILNTWETL